MIFNGLKTSRLQTPKYTAFRHFCQNPNLTSTQRLGFTPPHHKNSISTISQLDFDETLKVGSCEHLEQIPTVMVNDDICPANICPYQEYLRT